MPELFRESRCRACNGELDTFLSLGELYPSNFLRRDEFPRARTPFDLCACVDCQMVQLRYTVDPDTMFRQYWYKSGINETMQHELADIVHRASERVGLQRFDRIIDIGANDGTLLQNYPRSLSLLKVAFEPALNLNEALHKHATIVVPDYFPQGLTHLENLESRVKIITSIACFYDLDQPKLFVEAIAKTLHPLGIWVVQFQDWDQMQKATAFDNICMEHLVYYSLGSFERLIKPFGLQVVDAELRAVNGGSYRLYVGHRKGGWAVQPGVDALRQHEAGCDAWDTFNKFAWRCQEAKKQIQSAVGAMNRQHVQVDLYGASTKANTLLQWCGLTSGVIRQAWERSSEKFDLRTVGTDIPIVPETMGRADPPGALLAGIWQFRDAILSREALYLQEGGSIIFPLPKVDIVSARRGDAA